MIVLDLLCVIIDLCSTCSCSINCGWLRLCSILEVEPKLSRMQTKLDTKESKHKESQRNVFVLCCVRLSRSIYFRFYFLRVWLEKSSKSRTRNKSRTNDVRHTRIQSKGKSMQWVLLALCLCSTSFVHNRPNLRPNFFLVWLTLCPISVWFVFLFLTSKVEHLSRAQKSFTNVLGAQRKSNPRQARTQRNAKQFKPKLTTVNNAFDFLVLWLLCLRPSSVCLCSTFLSGAVNVFYALIACVRLLSGVNWVQQKQVEHRKSNTRELKAQKWT